MKKKLQEIIVNFRERADEDLDRICATLHTERNRASEINKKIKIYKDLYIKKLLSEAATSRMDSQELLDKILKYTYASYVVMLEARNRVWAYDYMAFSRRIGELWEPFCKLAFEFPLKQLTIISPPRFEDVQSSIRSELMAYIESLPLKDEEKAELGERCGLPWSLVDSGGIKLDLDLHFLQDRIKYNCDFKSGFSSNEKGNTNRLLLVASIYHFIGEDQRNILFVRQSEDLNNHYLTTIKNSPYWEVYCGEDCYTAIEKFSGFNLRKWIDENINWQADINPDFRDHLIQNDLIKYLTW